VPSLSHERSEPHPNGNIIGIFLRNADALGERTALIHGRRSVSYGELLSDVRRIAAYLHDRGLRKGDAVLIFVPMSIDLYAILLSVFYLGATAIFIDAWVDRSRLDAACRSIAIRAFIGIPKAHLLRFLSKEIRSIPLKLVSNTKRWKARQAVPPAEVSPDDTALVTFTTGSTGTPKGAKRTHWFLIAQHEALMRSFAISADDVDMPVLPIFTLSNLAAGATTVIPQVDPRRVEEFDAGRVVRDIIERNVRTTTGSPAFYERLARHCIDNGIRLPLAKIITGGSPVFPRLARLLLQAFPDTEVVIAYGSTEAEPISLIDARELVRRSEAIPPVGLPAGRPVEFIRVRIIEIREGPIVIGTEEEFSALEMPEGEIGEICVAGDHVLKEYYDNGQAWRESKIRVGEEVWHRTGDAGYIDDGELYLVGRVRQSFHYHGKRLFIFPFEERMLQIDGVRIGTIVRLGESLIAAVEPASKGISEEKLEEEMRRLEIPFDAVRVLDAIPRDPRHNSKIDYDRLKRMLV
jgi:acyl-CoA synthetase (AMP-forming)/AMP-acid ligase II